MKTSAHLTRILERASTGTAPSLKDCEYLLGLEENSFEAGLLKAAANVISRKRFKGRAVVLGQIGLEIAPCPGNCLFCAFGEGHTRLPSGRLSTTDILARARNFSRTGDLFALFLMTMHDFNMERLLTLVRTLRNRLPRQTQIVLNIGDFDIVRARELRSAGANGAYHILRLREGIDTALNPAARIRTIESIKQAGMNLYYGCEPVGPEHSPQELAQQIMVGVQYGCFQHCAMRRIAVPGSPLARRGQITEQRLAQITAVLALATLECKETRNIAVHEPNLLGLAAGANAIYAETGANPRDSKAETTTGRGLDIPGCRRMFIESGFESLLRGDGRVVPLVR
ncbi:MAG: radical SAM protein [Verrucomicrobia bacterium]|nr:radical SAM protein [Verrucomicrobiota bacterium]